MFYLFNLFLGFIFVYLDFNNIDSCLIKYLTIFNNFLYLLVKSVNKTALLASLFTCIADYFLLFTNNQLAGVLCFIIVQSNYMKLLDQYTFFPFVAILLWPVNPLIALASNYALLSLHNLYYSFKSRYQSKHQYYLFIAIYVVIFLLHLLISIYRSLLYLEFWFGFYTYLVSYSSVLVKLFQKNSFLIFIF